jgi:DNA repair exonuclease SbcCD nuclease subunit
MAEPFRFLHAADLHLERPPRGLVDVPEHLRTALVDAPYRAAERIFDAALRDHVDFVVLAGDILDPQAAGPRGLIFLTEQFQRLADKNIAVYWAGGRGDNFERWIDAWPLPAGVVRFPLHRLHHVIHERDGLPLAQILGTSTQHRRRVPAEQFHADPAGPFSIAVAYGSTEADALAHQAIRYWALGSEHDRRTLLSGPVTAHYPGTPQGRRPAETGPRGATVVHVDQEGRVRTTFISTDAVRFHHERLTLDAPLTVEHLREALSLRTAELLTDPFGPDWLVQWSVTGASPLPPALACERQAAQLVDQLRSEFGQHRPGVWTTSLELESHAAIDEERYEEESVLGEFLRTVRHYVEQPEAELNLEPLLSERHLAGLLAGEARVEPAARRRVLAEVARLGAELLTPQEP